VALALLTGTLTPCLAHSPTHQTYSPSWVL
jgi:hypothetical protein